MIKLSNKYTDFVKCRLKIQTVRFGIREFPLGPNQIEDTTTGEIIPITVNAVLQTTFDNLEKNDATMDGFSSLDELFTALQEFYPTIERTSPVTVIRFDLVGGEDT